ncbi:hypothetical protein V6N13_050938 [Hibiscus sabdariffa]
MNIKIPKPAQPCQPGPVFLPLCFHFLILEIVEFQWSNASITPPISSFSSIFFLQESKTPAPFPSGQIFM